MAVINTVALQRFLSLPNSTSAFSKSKSSLALPSYVSCIKIAAVAPTESRKSRPPTTAASINDEIDVIPVQSGDLTDQQGGMVPLINGEREDDESCLDQPGPSTSQIMGFAFESQAGGVGKGGVGFSSSSSSSGSPIEGGNQHKTVDRVINASIVLAAGTFAVTKMLTIDSDYWHVDRNLHCAGEQMPINIARPYDECLMSTCLKDYHLDEE